MLKEFAEYLRESAQPQIREIDGKNYCVTAAGGAEEILPCLDHPTTLEVFSLDALVTMIRTEASNMEDILYVSVRSPLNVDCFAQEDELMRCYRRVYYMACCNVPGFRDGYRDHDTAIIQLQADFQQNEGTEYLLALLSNISQDSNVTTKDNSVTQSVDVRRGTALLGSTRVEPRVKLRPYRTFPEVEQPESEFLLRLDEDAHVGLFEADGGMWKLTARKTIKAYLEDALAAEVRAGKVFISL